MAISPRDAVTISKTFHDATTLIDISTSLPRSSDEPAYLRPAPPYVRSDVHCELIPILYRLHYSILIAMQYSRGASKYTLRNLEPLMGRLCRLQPINCVLPAFGNTI